MPPDMNHYICANRNNNKTNAALIAQFVLTRYIYFKLIAKMYVLIMYVLCICYMYIYIFPPVNFLSRLSSLANSLFWKLSELKTFVVFLI